MILVIEVGNVRPELRSELELHAIGIVDCGTVKKDRIGLKCLQSLADETRKLDTPEESGSFNPKSA